MTNRQKVGWMVLCLFAGASVRMFINERPAVEPLYIGILSLAQWSLVLTPLLFLFSAVRVFFQERIAVIAGLMGSIFALPNPLLLERYMRASGLSWWTTFNMSPGDFGGVPAFAPWLIISVTACVLMLLLSITRLLPSRFNWRGVPLSQRTWPAVSLTLLSFFAWYVVSVSPYRIPVIVDAATPELTILHVKKNGGRFSEVSIRLYRDGRLYKTTYSRHLFQYAFPIEASMAIAPRDLRDAANSLTASMKTNRTGSAIKSLHGRDADGWYVLGNGEYAFTTDTGSRPPEQLVLLFNRLDALETVERDRGDRRDICFGFCYDPLAGLGVMYINQRCRWSPDGRTHSCL